MEIIFFGTSSGVPTKNRNVTAAAVKMINSKYWSLVDCGEGTQHQILKSNLSLNKLQAIYITHVHGDHCYGLPGLMASASMSSRTDPLLIIGPAPVNDFIQATQKFTDLRLTYEVMFIDVENICTTFDTDLPSGLGTCVEDYRKTIDFDVQALKLSHRVPSYAYRFSERNIERKLNSAKLKRDDIESGPVWGRIQKGENITLSDGRSIEGENYLLKGREPRKIIIAGDNDSPHLLTEFVSSVNVLVHEATYTDDVLEKVGKGPQHSSAKLVALFVEKVAMPNLILTHFSARYQDSEDAIAPILDIEKEARRYYSGSLFLANDFDVYRLNVSGNLLKL